MTYYILKILFIVLKYFLQINIARQTIQFELETLMTRPEQEMILMDMIHSVSG